jgi:PAS domain S-box-containing protein
MTRIGSGGEAEAAGEIRVDAQQALASWIQEIVPYGIFTTDLDLRITSWNEWLVSHSGLVSEKVIGRRLTDVYPELGPRRLEERYARALDGEVSMLSCALHRYLLPLPVTVSESGLPHMLQTARIAPLLQRETVVGTITMIEDVTQREFQAGILQRRQELDRLLSSALASLLLSNEPANEMPGIFATVSPALGLDAYVCYLVQNDQSSLRLCASSGFSPKQRESIATLPLSDEDRQAALSGTPGSTALLEAHAVTLRSMGLHGQCTFPLVAGDRLLGLATFGSFHRDAISSADANVLARISRYVAIALDRANRERETVAASRAKDDFLAALSHELRTPLNPVLLIASDAATDPEFPERAREAFRVIERNALLEARLIDDLLDLTRIERGKLSLDVQAVDVHAVLRDALETVRPDIVEQELKLEVSLHASASNVVADTGRLQQVFWNVVKNAVKFTPRGGKILVGSRSDQANGQIVIEVTDTGIGMGPKELARVFGAFMQGDHAEQGRSHRFGGLGLGLAISRKLIELHGGRIFASSGGKDRGSTFTIALPLKTAVAPMVRGSEPSPVKRETETPFLKNAGSRILLVEDHEATRNALVQILRQRGFKVFAAASSTAALHMAASEPFDLVLSDIGLPDGDGYALMQKLRDTYGLKGIALSGYGMEADLARSKDAGFLAHLTKPINVAILDRMLESAFSEV